MNKQNIYVSNPPNLQHAAGAINVELAIAGPKDVGFAGAWQRSWWLFCHAVCKVQATNINQ